MMTKINRNHKDSLFRFIFGRESNKELLLSLYNALNDTGYTNADDLEINTIDDVIYMKMKNDVSCLLGDYLSIYEHQSTFNPNMPVRSFEYAAKLYSKYIISKKYDVYGRKLIKLPAPQCYVFYNGTDKCEDKKILRLSDAFELDVQGYEWTVIMLNVNEGHNRKLFEKCQALKEYAGLVQAIRNYEKDGNISDAVDRAVNETISLKGVLSGMLEKHRAEVIDMCITEYDEELHLKTIREEGRAEGKSEGKFEERTDAIRKMIDVGFEKEAILKIYSEDEYEKALMM